jgi:hypothetical protein
VPQHAQAIELGPYTLLDKLGEGGSGQVYRARGPEGTVAIKLLAPAGDTDEAARARFVREIAALERISHPNLVRMLGHGVDAELGPYLVLPLLAGTNLRALCAQAMCPEAAILLVQPIAHATAALHAAGFVHRDLKPENAIAAPDGAVTVIDLGLAWREGMTRHTETGTVVGSVGYMAPEQIEGRTVDSRADVWALGVMLYEMIAGKRPFARARPAEEAAAALVGAFPKLTAADRRASDELAALVARCLALDPAARPSSTELASALDAMIDWTEDVAVDRAAVVANTQAYVARVAPFRVRRFERLAREALDASKPFEALAHCDRGLAYAPEHPGLLAAVAAAEAATAGPRRGTAVDAHAVTAVAPARRPTRTSPWLWVGLSLGVAALIGGAILLRGNDSAKTTDDPWNRNGPDMSVPAKVQQAKLVPDDKDLKMMKDFVGVFGRAVKHGPRDKNAPMTEEDKQLASDMINVFGEAIDRAADNGSNH